MQAALPFVVFGAVGLSVVMSIVFLLSKGSSYDEIGAGGLPDLERHGGDDAPMAFGAGMTGHETAPPGAAGQAEREREIRQMVQARSERRVRRGEAPLDVDAEVARLIAAEPVPAIHDAGIAEEVLQLVVARNERRERQGLEPLDIEAEVARTLAELDP